MEINCPPAGGNVSVKGQGSGPGGTICVRGTVIDQDTDGTGLPTTIRTCVVVGWVEPPPPDPDSPPSGWVDVTPAGQFWFAAGVGVPEWSPAGVPCTAIAWYKTGGNPWSEPVAVQFVAGGPSAIDCCAVSEHGVVTAADSSAFRSWPPPPPPLPPNLGGSN